jgi:hypothetical protein
MDIDGFLRDGFVRVERAVPPKLVDECVALLWNEIEAKPDDPATWRQPVYWVGGMTQPSFTRAASTRVLCEAFDLLVGPKRWAPRIGLGSFPLRFPHPEEPDDAGWHIEGSYTPLGETEYFTNVTSSCRALLMLFLFTDVDEDDAPTRIRMGSHRDVRAVLAPFGERGAPGSVSSPLVAAASAHRPVALATGRATCSCVIRSWCTPLSRTMAPGRGSWRSRRSIRPGSSRGTRSRMGTRRSARRSRTEERGHPLTARRSRHGARAGGRVAG